MRSILVEDEDKLRAVLADKIKSFCPQVEVIGQAANAVEAFDLITQHSPDVVFLDINMPGESGFDLLKRLPNLNFEIIFVTGFEQYAIDAIRFCAVGYIMKPIETEDLIKAVFKAQQRVDQKAENERNKQLLHNLMHPGNVHNKIGIPTMSGLDFVSTSAIVRCEGLQKCTRVVVQGGKDIISSYNLGEFRDLLEIYGFYSIHKSHIINVSHIQKVDREGMVYLIDGSAVPVSKRKKQEFLELLPRIRGGES